MCFIVSSDDNESIKISSSPSYIVFNRWFDNNDIPLNINKTADKEVTYHASLPKKLPIHSKMIIKSNNLAVKVYTEGKLLTEENKNKYDSFGEKYNIINLDDMGKNKKIYIHIIPLTKDNSAICDSIHITTQNEFLFTLLKKAVLPIVLISILSILCVYLLIKGIKNIFNFKKHIYGVFVLTDIIFIIFYHSTLPYLVNNNGTLAYTMKYISAMLLPILLSAFTKTILKYKSVAFNIFDISICTYTVIRLALFAEISTPLNENKYINIVILSVLILITILHENQRSKKVKNNY